MAINPKGTIQSAMAALGSGQFDKAEALYQGLAIHFPGLFDTHMLGGVIAANQGRRDIAIERFKSALRINAQNPSTQNWLSVMLRETGQIAPALEHAMAANNLRPGEPGMLCNLGLCLFDSGDVMKALATFQQAVALRPEEALYHAGLAKCFAAIGRDLDALRELRAAADISPDFAGLLKLGDLLTTLGRQQEAMGVFEKALKLSPDSAHLHVTMSRTLSDLLRNDEAAIYLERAQQLDPHLCDVYVRRAYVCQMMGRFEEAEKEFEKAIELNPGEGIAYYGIVSAKKIVEADRPLIERMQKALAQPNLSSDDKSNLHYALGKAFDNLSDYRQAMDEYDEANQVTWEAKLRTRPFNALQSAAEIDTRIKLFDHDFFERSKGVSSTVRPIFIVGMPRSGTTLVEQILSCHPQVAGAGELSFWAHAEGRIVDVSKMSVRNDVLKDSANEYLELIAEYANGKLHVTDKNPANCLVLGSIHAAFPNARIIHTRRNAVDTALSIYTTPMRTPPEFACVKENIVLFTRHYQRLMDHWRSTLPGNRFMEIDYEDLAAHGDQSARRLLEFCGLEWDEACLHPENNPRAVRTPSFWQVRQPLYTTSIERWRKYEPYLGAFGQLLTHP